MRQKTIDLYQFDELNDKAKEKARSWYRETSADDTFWSEHILEDEAPALLKRLGYCDPKIQYRGFWSQGDGACFSGTWYSSNCKYAEVIKDYAHDKEVARIADAFGTLLFAHPGMSASLTHRGHYPHEMSISFDVEFDAEDHDSSDDAQAEEEFIELSRDLMRWIYKTLEEAYEGANADEQVDENIRCNEYEFTIDGDRA
jgi:hypothetical protein